MRSIKLIFGILYPSIKEQLKEQDITLSEDFKKEEKIRKSINMLYLHGYLSESQMQQKCNKLMKEIIKKIENS